jgi:hypothetical protein
MIPISRRVAAVDHLSVPDFAPTAAGGDGALGVLVITVNTATA